MGTLTTEISERALAIFAKTGVLWEDQHFVYVSGDHGSGWVNKDVLYLVPDNVLELTELLSRLLVDVEADIICGPATGGLVISQWLAYHMKLLSVFAEHDPHPDAMTHTDQHGALRPAFMLRRHYDQAVRGKRVIAVDDIVNTGHSIRQTINAVERAGGKVVCAATLCTRGNVDGTTLGAPRFAALSEIKIPSWPAAGCKLCVKGVPVNQEYAHGFEFVQSQKNQSTA